ncbi:MAG TPA: hypothetical protein VLF61_01290 [Rhabdochlamydiaceae bacterium]|nr:hypothetical protein [Rhabdochlamydiaceae bacterium]
MTPSSAFVCRAFLEKCQPNERAVLFRFLPEKDQLLIEQLPTISADFKKSFLSLKKTLDKVHFSWFAPHLRTLPENDIRLFLSALNPQQAEGLKNILLFSDHFPPLTEAGETYIQEILIQKLSQNEPLLPLNFLPPSPLNALLELNQEELETLVRYLGLHDLAFEMRQIIETAKLKRVFSTLTKNEKEYLQALLPQKEPVVLKRLQIQNWDGRRESLKLLIQQRGLQRLGKALYDEQPTLIWLVAHHFDISMGQELLKACTKIELAKAKQHLINQTVKILSFIKKS